MWIVVALLVVGVVYCATRSGNVPKQGLPPNDSVPALGAIGEPSPASTGGGNPLLNRTNQVGFGLYTPIARIGSGLVSSPPQTAFQRLTAVTPANETPALTSVNASDLMNDTPPLPQSPKNGIVNPRAGAIRPKI